MRINVEIWNIFVVSMLLMLLYAALNPACSVINTALQDSDTQLTSKLGYISMSLMSLVSIVGGIIAPPLRTVMGYRSIMVFSALLHMAVYIGMIILTEWAVLIGSIVTGLGEGIIWVVIPNFVTITSEHRNIERNLSYHMFIYNFNGIAGNILNYLCLDESTAITDSSRIRYFTVCTVFTLLASLLGGVAVCSPSSSDQFSSLNEDSDLRLISDIEPDTTKLLPDSDTEKTIEYNSEEHFPQTLYQRSLAYIRNQASGHLQSVACTLGQFPL
ncbi:uncharacterized protein LOC134817182 [Bolinopsis microptera]|uniref:uncharacterized protein LOC134817182 n=1 Tax=Bolinopsis microptera TaxID=2820187 RepID=UPI003078B9A2